MLSTRYYCHILVTLQFSRHSFEKSRNKKKFMKIRVVGAEFFCLDGRTRSQIDSHDEANSRNLQFCERA